MNSQNSVRTVAEISDEFGIPVSTITRAIQTHELDAIESTSGGATLEDNQALQAWISAHHPARIYASLAGDPEVPTDERMQLLAKLPQLARRLVNADYAALTLGNQNGHIADMIVSGMSDAQSAPIGHPPIGKGVLGNLDHSDAPIRLGNIATHQRSTGFPEGHPDMEAMIGVGVTSDKNHDETIRIYVTRSAGQPSFTAEDQALVESLASFAKQALEFDSLRKTETDLRIRAEDAEKAKSEFMSMINHDLKNPMAAMQVALDMARYTDHYPVEDLFVDLQSSLNVQRTLIDSLLDMARLGKTSQDYEFENEFPVDLINEVVNRQRKTPLGTDRIIESSVAENLPAVRCDPTQMGRVFDNLISNALKYSNDDVAVEVSHNENDDFVTFTVSDKGEGIPDTEVARIFEPFERITKTDTPIEGLGLGLAICKTIVEAHQGTISYSRTTGRNTTSTFQVTLPRTTD